MSLAHPNRNPDAIYASFDRVPAPKGASEHIEAFAGALAGALGALDLVTLGDGGGSRGARAAPPEPGDPPALRRIRVGVGGDFLDRVSCFRADRKSVV
jgi:hypothetical protein